MPFFKYTTVEKWKVCVPFAWMDCSQELLTQGKAVLNIWNMWFSSKRRAVLAAWHQEALHNFFHKQNCQSCTLPVMLIHSIFISLLHTMRWFFFLTFWDEFALFKNRKKSYILYPLLWNYKNCKDSLSHEQDRGWEERWGGGGNPSCLNAQDSHADGSFSWKKYVWLVRWNLSMQ